MLSCASGGMVLGGGRGHGFRTYSFPERPRSATVTTVSTIPWLADVLSLFLGMVDSPAPGTLVLDLATRNDELANRHDHNQFLRFL